MKNSPVQQATGTDLIQGEFQLALPAPEPARQSNQRRSQRSLQSMIELALSRGYAHSIGDLLDQVATLRQYRMYNALLAVLQYPHAQHLLSADEWKERWGRLVRPGEHPVVLLLPFGPLMFVFDVSQTEGTSDTPERLPTGTWNPYAMEYVAEAADALFRATANAKHDGVRVHSDTRGYRSAGCIERSMDGVTQPVPGASAGRSHQVLVSVRYELMLNASSTATEQLATLAHELGHLYCGHLGSSKQDWWPARDFGEHRQYEFEAESVARLVFRRIAPGVDLPPHLDQYFTVGEALPIDGWDHVVAAADRIVAMCQDASPRRR